MNDRMKASSPLSSSACVGVAVVLSLCIFHADSVARTLRVGPSRTYTTVRDASQATQDGDTVLVDAGVYSADVTEWTSNNLVVRGVGGRAYMRSDGVVEQDKGIWVFYGTNFTAENIEFSGAASVSGWNGAGIRFDTPGNLVLRNCYFHDNEDGILGGADSILIEYSVFDHNGHGDGQSHNMYVHGRSFTIRYSYTHRAWIGHNIKTRARNNYILYNRIMDEADGESSYSIDIPDCGRSYVIGNVIEQGPSSVNSSMLAYGMESQLGVNDLYVMSNTLVNNLGSGTFMRLRAGSIVKAMNNIFYGPGTYWSSGSTVTESSNYFEPSFNNSPRFANPAAYDFHLTSISPSSVLNAGALPGISSTGYILTPTSQYVYDAQGKTRSLLGLLDLGAFEYTAPGGPDVAYPAPIRDLRYR
ncbi:MAG: hypothetical protein E6K76_06750 [Candidatus Eisenbacteria bacterium]|uniref:Right handed beta helix domain-containing protein n=1 Tax=Eiseniibacteriota bacterium TaxID=2212470 RepID=A0A538T593_UNCEI|nr:MAG: hypothetical protein E6K76_06750 [Candidatus Eisenbacteria bacterium]